MLYHFKNTFNTIGSTFKQYKTLQNTCKELWSAFNELQSIFKKVLPKYVIHSTSQKVL